MLQNTEEPDGTVAELVTKWFKANMNYDTPEQLQGTYRDDIKGKTLPEEQKAKVIIASRCSERALSFPWKETLHLNYFVDLPFCRWDLPFDEFP